MVTVSSRLLQVDGEDVIIGKTTPLPPPSEDDMVRDKRFTKKDSSTCIRHNEAGIVDAVWCYMQSSHVHHSADLFSSLWIPTPTNPGQP